jgi:hypothetical protein
LVTALAAFKGTEYMFLSVYPDEEPINLLKQIDGILLRAGWKRAQPSSPLPPTINVYGRDVNVLVTAGMTAGVQISIESRESGTEIKSRTIETLPQYIRAAITLNLNLSPNLYPPQGDIGKTVSMESGSATFVRIAVGRKP